MLVTSGNNIRSELYSVQKTGALKRQEMRLMMFGERIAIIVNTFVFDLLDAVFGLLASIFGGLAAIFGAYPRS